MWQDRAIGIQLNYTSYWKALQGTIMDRAREAESLHEDATRNPSTSSSQGMLVATMAKGQYRNRLCGTGPEEHYMLVSPSPKYW